MQVASLNKVLYRLSVKEAITYTLDKHTDGQIFWQFAYPTTKVQ